MSVTLGAAHFWATRKGFDFTDAGAELPLVRLVLLGIQVVGAWRLCDGPVTGFAAHTHMAVGSPR